MNSPLHYKTLRLHFLSCVLPFMTKVRHRAPNIIYPEASVKLKAIDQKSVASDLVTAAPTRKKQLTGATDALIDIASTVNSSSHC